MNIISEEKETKARKRHVCEFCSAAIVEGEKYMNSKFAYDGRAYDWKTHRYCSKLANTLNMYSDCDEGVNGDDFKEIVSDNYISILINEMPLPDRKKYSEIISQLTHVEFRDKLWHVIRYFNKININ